MTNDEPTADADPMQPSPSASWRDQVAAVDPAGHSRMVDYLGYVTGKDAIPEQYRELMLFAVSVGIRFRPSVVTHGANALQAGASKDQLVQAAQLAGLSAGFTAVILAMDVISEITDPAAGE